ncbi:MAG: AMP-binding protein [Pseudomonadota bacterium]
MREYSNATQEAAKMPVVRPEQIHLERCIRHIIYRDIEANVGDNVRRTEFGRKLTVAASQSSDASHLPLGGSGLGLDSLSTISAATAVARFFDMGVSGLDDYLVFDETLGEWGNRVAQHLDTLGPDATLVFETSGSTDNPKSVRKSLAELQFEVLALGATVVPKGTRRIVSLVPARHIFGWLFTVQLPAKFRIPVFEATFRGTATVFEQLGSGDFVVGTPFNWEMLRSLGRDFPPGVRGVTAAGPMAPELRSGLKTAGLVSLLEVFGSTETGGIGWRADGESDFKLLPHCSRFGDCLVSKFSGIPLPLQDHLDWRDACRFLPRERIDHAVQIAGVNVSLRKVRDVLCASDLVDDAAVRLEGNRLKAFVVPASSIAIEQLVQALEMHMSQALEPAARPAHYDFGEELPRNAMGKPSDWRTG